MRAISLCAAFVWVCAIVGACGSSSSGTEGLDGGPSDGGNPVDCPASKPAPGTPCAPNGLQCSYGCNVAAACTSGLWAIAESAIPCPGPDAAPSDASRRLQDGAIV